MDTWSCASAIVLNVLDVAVNEKILKRNDIRNNSNRGNSSATVSNVQSKVNLTEQDSFWGEGNILCLPRYKTKIHPARLAGEMSKLDMTAFWQNVRVANSCVR